MGIPEIILNLMELKGLTRYRLAKLSNVPYTTLIKVLDGTTKNPQIETLSAIAEALGVSLDQLTGDTSHLIRETQAEYKINPEVIPEWATSKDKRDFKKMLEDDTPVMFDGVPIEGEARQRVMDILTGLFWEAKEMNKKTYGRKNDNNKNDASGDTKE